MVQPMRKELTRLGVEELTTADEVDAAFEASSDATMLLVINSVCGCAAGNARPAVAMATQADVQPDRYVTVFAGQDLEPFMALFRNGDPVYVIERKHIEGRNASAIAADLKEAYEAYCTDEPPADDAPTGPTVEETGGDNGLPDTFRSFN